MNTIASSPPPATPPSATSTEIVVQFSSGNNLAALLNASPPVPPGGTLVIEGVGVTAMLPVDTPPLRARALEELEVLRRAMQHHDIGTVVLRDPLFGGEQVVTRDSFSSRDRRPNELPPARQARSVRPPSSSDFVFRLDPAKRVMTVELHPLYDPVEILSQAMRQVPSGVTRIEIAGDGATLALDYPHFAATYFAELRRIRDELAYHANIQSIVLQDTRFPGSIQTITKDGIHTTPVQYPSAPNVRPEPHYSWPNGWVLQVPIGGFSITQTIEELLAKYPSLANKTLILDSYRDDVNAWRAGTREHFFDLLTAKGPIGDWARRELEQLKKLAQDKGLAIVIDPRRMGQTSHVPGITPQSLKAQLDYEMLPVPEGVPRTRSK